MKKSDKTKTYSDDNKTTIYGDSGKLTKESVHNLKAGDRIVLKDIEYLILEIISQSTGEAVIYKVKDISNNIFALKLYYEFYNSENEPNTEALTRIKNIDDEDILKLLDFGTGINKYKGKYCFEILDFAYGFDLLSVESIKEKYRLDFIVKEVIPQIFKGILRLHANKIYHCDLKPQNIFYLDKEQKEIVIGDYGSAKTFEFDAAKSSRKTTTVKGTDFYLPPEQARGFISEKNDYYSFGMILLHLVYPEKILLNENKPKSLSHEKLKQIIERQFEAKPIIDYNPNYKRINSLIEGLTLVDFNLRWGKEQVQKWIDGKELEVIYSTSYQKIADDIGVSVKPLKFSGYTINTALDLRDYILNDQNWYATLIEDTDNWEDLIEWILNFYSGDKSKRSAFNRIVKLYSQEGIDFMADAIIRFFIPEHPVLIGLQSFSFAKDDDILKPTVLAFSHLIFDLWDNSTEHDIKLFIFSYEFALRQTKNQAEANMALNILYEKLFINENTENDFEDYKVYAYTKINKGSLKAIREFLIDLSAADFKIEVISLDNENILNYNIRKSVSGYFQSIGINKTLSQKSLKKQVLQLRCPDSSNSFNDFIEITFINFLEDLGSKHNIINSISPVSKEEIKEQIKTIFININERIEKETSDLKKDFSGLISTISGFTTNLNTINSYFQNNKLDKAQKTYEDILGLKSELKKVVEAKEFLMQYRNNAEKSSLVMPLLKEAGKLIKSNNYKEIEKAWQILTIEHSFKCKTLFDIQDIIKHEQIFYKKIGWFKKIEVNSSIFSMAMSPDGNSIVIGALFNKDLLLKIISTDSGKVEFTIKNLEFLPKFISVSKNGLIACTGYDKSTLVYDLNSGKKIHSIKELEQKARSALFSPDDKYLAVSGNSKTVLCDTKTWKLEKIIDAETPICFHPFKNLLATGPFYIKFIDINTDESSIISEKDPKDIRKLCFSPDGKSIASNCRDGVLQVWEVKKAKLVHSLYGHDKDYYSNACICFSPDGKILASVLNPEAVRFWNVSTGEPLLTLRNFYSIKGLAFHPDGKYIAVADKYEVILIYLKRVALHTHKMKIPDFIIYEKEQSDELKKIKFPKIRFSFRVPYEIKLSSFFLVFLFFFLIPFYPSIFGFFRSLINYENTTDKNLTIEKIEMIPVKGGTFRMGSEDERHIHTVNLNDFYISKYEITNEQFCQFLNIYGSDMVKNGQYEGGRMFHYRTSNFKVWGIHYAKRGWRPNDRAEDYPAIQITWYGANEFCKWAGGRLPTEAEWEYAARGGNKSKAYKYSGSNNALEVAWSNYKTYKVGTKKPNELGIYDMSGNVREWCEDWYDKDYYSKSPKNNPVNLKESRTKVVRGDIWDKYIPQTPSSRMYANPGTDFSRSGFRLCFGDSLINLEK